MFPYVANNLSVCYKQFQSQNFKKAKLTNNDAILPKMLGLRSIPVDTGRKLNVRKTFRRRPGRLLNVLCAFNVRPVSLLAIFKVKGCLRFTRQK